MDRILPSESDISMPGASSGVMRAIPSAAQPTFIGFVATTHDCLVLFEACRVGALKRVQRRLTEQERERCIRSGSVFVWEESESGIKRWTDSKSWSPSRIKGSFLVYREVDEATARRRSSPNTSDDDMQSPSTGGDARDRRRSGGGRDRSSPSGAGQARQKPNQLLTKKSISVRTKEGGKLHVVCYYTKSDVASGRLLTPSQDPALAHLAVRVGLYPDIIPEVSTMGSTVSSPADRGHLQSMESLASTPSSARRMSLSGHTPTSMAHSPSAAFSAHRGGSPRASEVLIGGPGRSQEYAYAVYGSGYQDGSGRHSLMDDGLPPHGVSAGAAGYAKYRGQSEYMPNSPRTYRTHPYARTDIPASLLAAYTPRSMHNISRQLGEQRDGTYSADRDVAYGSPLWDAATPASTTQSATSPRERPANPSSPTTQAAGATTERPSSATGTSTRSGGSHGPRLPPLRMALSREEEEARWHGY
ncbi:Gti1/Pac2 family-domain-containing protein [Phlyctochytrium arcticum]|nr:Gti1/Pac2 family-domain-containing protein [Phlyctochytrium arcticum]